MNFSNRLKQLSPNYHSVKEFPSKKIEVKVCVNEKILEKEAEKLAERIEKKWKYMLNEINDIYKTGMEKLKKGFLDQAEVLFQEGLQKIKNCHFYSVEKLKIENNLKDALKRQII